MIHVTVYQTVVPKKYFASSLKMDLKNDLNS